MPSGSSTIFASGVALDASAFDPFVYTAPTTPSPIIIMRSSLPFSFMSRAMATVPPAPITLKTSTRPVMSSSSMIFTAVRAVRSYPPPGLFGTIIRSLCIPVCSPPRVTPHPARSTAAQTRLVRISSRLIRVVLIRVPSVANVMLSNTGPDSDGSHCFGRNESIGH
jgi:hypothetical protein